MDPASANDGLQGALTQVNAAIESNDMDQLVASLESANAELEKATSNTVLGSSLLGDKLGGLINFAAPLSNTAKFMGAWSGDTRDLAEAAGEAQTQIDELRASSDSTFNAMAALAKVATGATQALQDNLDAMRARCQEAIRALNAELDYQQSIAAAAGR